MTERLQGIRRASIIGLWGNAVLSATKICAGIVAGSLAVLGDGIDSAADVVISLMTLFVSRYMMKPSDREHPFGHGRAETIATTIVAFIVFFAGAQLLFRSIGDLAGGMVKEVPHSLALYVTGFSIAGKLLLAFSQAKAGKKYKSEMLSANAKNMQTDVLISVAVLAGLIFTFILDMPILDPICALIVSLWILKAGLGIFRTVNLELMDGTADTNLYRTIFEAVHNVEGAARPHRTRIRKIANLYDIVLDIEVDPGMRLYQAHEIAVSVENAIREKIDNVFDIMVHLEPKGNAETNESYGLCETEIDKAEET